MYSINIVKVHLVTNNIVGSGGRSVKRRTVNRGDGGSSHLPPFRYLGNFVHATFACVFRKRH